MPACSTQEPVAARSSRSEPIDLEDIALSRVYSRRTETVKQVSKDSEQRQVQLSAILTGRLEWKELASGRRSGIKVSAEEIVE